MEDAMQILVLILSGFLALFLLLSLIFVVLLIKLTRAIRRVVDRAEEAVNNVEIATSIFKSAAGPMAAGRILLNIVDLFKGKQADFVKKKRSK